MSFAGVQFPAIAYRQAAAQVVTCLKGRLAWQHVVKDYVTHDLIDEILKSEEEHMNWLETQLDLIDNMGEKNYLLSAK